MKKKNIVLENLYLTIYDDLRSYYPDRFQSNPEVHTGAVSHLRNESCVDDVRCLIGKTADSREY